MSLSRQLLALVLTTQNKQETYTKNTKSNLIYNKQTQENTKHTNQHQKRGVTTGWLPETAGAGLPGLNGSGDAAAVPPSLL